MTDIQQQFANNVPVACHFLFVVCDEMFVFVICSHRQNQQHITNNKQQLKATSNTHETISISRHTTNNRYTVVCFVHVALLFKKPAISNSQVICCLLPVIGWLLFVFACPLLASYCVVLLVVCCTLLVVVVSCKQQTTHNNQPATRTKQQAKRNGQEKQSNKQATSTNGTEARMASGDMYTLDVRLAPPPPSHLPLVTDTNTNHQRCSPIFDPCQWVTSSWGGCSEQGTHLLCGHCVHPYLR